MRQNVEKLIIQKKINSFHKLLTYIIQNIEIIE